MDRVTKETRSKIMSKIRSRGNKTTERRLRAYLVRYGIRGWKMHDSSLPGTPDFVFPAEKVAVFVDGCFWHGCPKCAKRPKSNQRFWDEKVENNVRRDRRVHRKRRRRGWSVIRIWEHNAKRFPNKQILRIKLSLQKA